MGRAVGAGAVLLVSLAVAGWYVYRVTHPQQAILFLIWPEEARSGAMLRVNKQDWSVPATGPVQVKLPPGEYNLVVKRRGFEPIEYSFVAGSGDRISYTPEWRKSSANASEATTGFKTNGSKGSSQSTASAGGRAKSGEAKNGESGLAPPLPPPQSGIPGYDDWDQSLSRGQSRAKAQGKSVLLVFVSSDSDELSIALRREVLATDDFRQIAGVPFSWVVVDFPTTNAGFNRVMDRAQNNWLAQRFLVIPNQIPTILACDADGRPFARFVGYRSGIADRYIAGLRRLPEYVRERDRKFAEVEAAAASEQPKAAAAAAAWLMDHEIAYYYRAELDRWWIKALENDPDDRSGWKEACFCCRWLARLYESALLQKEDAARSIVELDEWKSNQAAHDPDRAVTMYFMAIQLLLVAGQESHIQPLAKAGSEYQPNRETAQAVLQLLKALREGDSSRPQPAQQGHGTGFVVAADGLILTNQHVVAGKDVVSVEAKEFDSELPGRVVARDEERDLALVKLELPSEKKLTPLRFASGSPRVGDELKAIGFPAGAIGKGASITRGLLSADPAGVPDGLLQFDGTINPGNSGGPILDGRGQVVGVVVAKTAQGRFVDSFGIGIPASTALAFLKSANVEPSLAPKDADDSTKADYEKLMPSVVKIVIRAQ